jgi:hypothetical protein
MDYFERIIKTLLEDEGFWVRQSFKVNLTKEEKRKIGKPSIPRPEVDLIAYRASDGVVLALETKSFLDSPGVKLEELKAQHKIPKGRYKLFTCKSYRSVVFNRLKDELVASGMVPKSVTINLGLVAGKVYQSRSDDVREYFSSKGWFLWSPKDIKDRVNNLAMKGYENDPAFIVAKILMR